MGLSLKAQKEYVTVEVVKDLAGTEELAEIKNFSATRHPVVGRLRDLSAPGVMPRLYVGTALAAHYGVDKGTLRDLLNGQMAAAGTDLGFIYCNGSHKTQFYTPAGREIADRHFRWVRDTQEKFVRVNDVLDKLGISRDRAFKYLGNFFPKGTAHDAREVLGIEVRRTTLGGPPTYYLPKEYSEFPKILEGWGRALSWDDERRRLPDEVRAYVFAAELESELGLKSGTVARFVRRRNQENLGGETIGFIVDTAEKTVHPPNTILPGPNPLVIDPVHAQQIRDYYLLQARVRDDLTSLESLGTALNMSPVALRRWAAKEGKTDAAGNVNLFGIPLERHGRGLYLPKALLSDSQISKIRDVKINHGPHKSDRLIALENELKCCHDTAAERQRQFMEVYTSGPSIVQPHQGEVVTVEPPPGKETYYISAGLGLKDSPRGARILEKAYGHILEARPARSQKLLVRNGRETQMKMDAALDPRLTYKTPKGRMTVYSTNFLAEATDMSFPDVIAELMDRKILRQTLSEGVQVVSKADGERFVKEHCVKAYVVAERFDMSAKAVRTSAQELNIGVELSGAFYIPKKRAVDFDDSTRSKPVQAEATIEVAQLAAQLGLAPNVLERAIAVGAQDQGGVRQFHGFNVTGSGKKLRLPQSAARGWRRHHEFLRALRENTDLQFI